MTNWTLAGEKPYNHGQQKKTLHHTKFGKECGETQEGCLGSQGEAAKVPEGYFSSTGVPTEQCGDWTPSWAPQPIAPEPERNPDNFQLWNAAGVLSAKEKRPEKQRASQRANTKFCWQPLTLGARRGRAEWTRDAWGESGVGVSGERTEGPAARIHCWVIDHSAEATLSGRALLSEWHQPEGKQEPCPLELLCPTLWCLSLTDWLD